MLTLFLTFRGTWTQRTSSLCEETFIQGVFHQPVEVCSKLQSSILSYVNPFLHRPSLAVQRSNLLSLLWRISSSMASPDSRKPYGGGAPLWLVRPTVQNYMNTFRDTGSSHYPPLPLSFRLFLMAASICSSSVIPAVYDDEFVVESYW